MHYYEKVNSKDITSEYIDFIWSKAGSYNWFYLSLVKTLVKFNSLSFGQLRRVTEDIKRPSAANNVPSTIKAGQVLELKRGWANKLKNDHQMKYFFRNLEVTQVVKETLFAVLVNVVFSTKVITSCNYCGRDLDCPISKACGIGPVCLKHMGIQRPTLETANETLKVIEEVVKSIGEIGPIWIPKSQLRTREETTELKVS